MKAKRISSLCSMIKIWKHGRNSYFQNCWSVDLVVILLAENDAWITVRDKASTRGRFPRNLVTNSSLNLVIHPIWWQNCHQIWCQIRWITQLSDQFITKFGDEFSESPNLVMNLAANFVTNLVTNLSPNFVTNLSPNLVTNLVNH